MKETVYESVESDIRWSAGKEKTKLRELDVRNEITNHQTQKAARWFSEINKSSIVGRLKRLKLFWAALRKEEKKWIKLMNFAAVLNYLVDKFAAVDAFLHRLKYPQANKEQRQPMQKIQSDLRWRQ